jgi:putative sterol carrier protein
MTKEANVALTFPSPEWTAQLQTVVNNDQAYAQSAKTWEGDFYFIIEPGPGIKQPVKMYLDLWHGKCREAHIVAGAENKVPEFTISGTLETYRRVFEKKLDPIQALMTRKLKVQGNMMKIVRSVKATLDLVNCCSMVPTSYPDQVLS